MLAEKLGMTPEKAEEWIVNLIRNARLDAAIDSKEVRARLLSFRILSFHSLHGVPHHSLTFAGPCCDGDASAQCVQPGH